jgi:hypothetical protein
MACSCFQDNKIKKSEKKPQNSVTWGMKMSLNEQKILIYKVILNYLTRNIHVLETCIFWSTPRFCRFLWKMRLDWFPCIYHCRNRYQQQ